MGFSNPVTQVGISGSEKTGKVTIAAGTGLSVAQTGSTVTLSANSSAGVPAIAVVNNGSFANQLSSSSSISLTLGFTPTTGNILILCAGDATTSGTISSITQTGVTWTKAILEDGGAGVAKAEIWYGVVGTSPSTSITVATNTATCRIGFIFSEVQGLDASGGLDQTKGTTGSSTTISSGTTSTTTQGSEIWVACLAGNPGGGGTSTIGSPGNGFTQLDQVAMDTSTTNKIAFEYKIVNTTGTASTSASQTNSGGWSGAIATFGNAASTSTTAVASIKADSNTPLTGAVTLASGSGIALSQSGQTITVATGGGTILNNPAVRCHTTTDQNLSSSGVAITFETNDYDIGNSTQHSTSTNTSRITPQTAGKWHFSTSIPMSNQNATVNLTVFLKVNGTTIITGQQITVSQTAQTYLCATTDYNMNGSTDYMEVIVFSNSNAGTTTHNNFNPHFEAHLISS